MRQARTGEGASSGQIQFSILNTTGLKGRFQSLFSDRDAVIERVPADPQRPLLVFDGDCSFCKMWVGYWQSLTRDRVEYLPYQTVKDRFPEVPLSAFQSAVQFFEDGKRYMAGEPV